VAGSPWLPRLVNCSLLKAIGKPRAVLFIEAWQKVLIIVGVFITVPISSVALVWGQATVSTVSLLISMNSVRRFASIPIRAQARAAVGPLLATGGMSIMLIGIQKYSHLSYTSELFILIAAGVAAYALLGLLLSIQAQRVVLQAVFEKIAPARQRT
jgi:hypothetical protein